MDDNAIIELYFARSEQAIAETAVKYGGYCYRIAHQILDNREDSEESVQDTYLAAWRNMPPRRPSILATFLGKITRYISLNRWKQRHAAKRGGGEVVLSVPKQAEVDMDGDGTPETLLWLRVNNANDYGILVLHREEGILRGDSFAYRQMFQVKQDGTFSYSGQEDGVGRLRFDSGVPVIEPISSTGQEEKADLLWSDHSG